MSARPYHKRYHSDALAGFMSLTLEERGAYQTLLDLIYDRGGPILDNERLLAGYMGCSVRKWRLLREQLIEKRKIRLNDAGEITNDRAEKEFENDAKTARKLAENGSSGGRKTAEKLKKSNENNETEAAPLQPGLSHTRYQIPDSKKDRSEHSNPRADLRADDAPPGPFELQAREVADVIRLTRPTSPNDREQLRQWLRDGLHFEFHVIEAAKQIAARELGRGRSISGFRYLDGAVREYAAEWHADRARYQEIAAGGSR